MWMLRMLWFIIAYDLSRYSYMDDVKEKMSFFVLHVQNGTRFSKFLWDYFGLCKWKPKKIKHELFTVELENA